MRNLQQRAEALGRVEAELREEMAASLGRIGRRLAGLITEMKELERALATAHPEIRPALLSQFRSLRSQADLYHWYLIVQREAIGIRNHDPVLAEYQIPATPAV